MVGLTSRFRGLLGEQLCHLHLLHGSHDSRKVLPFKILLDPGGVNMVVCTGLHTFLFAGHPGPTERSCSSQQRPGPGECRRRLAGGVVESLIQQLPSEQLIPAIKQEGLTVALRGCSALPQRLDVSVPTQHTWRQTGMLGSSARVTGGQGLDWFPSSWLLLQERKVYMELQSIKNALLKAFRKEYAVKIDSHMHKDSQGPRLLPGAPFYGGLMVRHV